MLSNIKLGVVLGMYMYMVEAINERRLVFVGIEVLYGIERNSFG